MRAAIAMLCLLAGCSGGEPQVLFGQSQCRVATTPETRTVSRMTGVCLVWSKVGSTRTCTYYQRINVRERKQSVLCSKFEWVDDRTVE